MTWEPYFNTHITYLYEDDSQLILPNTNITISFHEYHIRMASTDKEWLDDNQTHMPSHELKYGKFSLWDNPLIFMIGGLCGAKPKFIKHRGLNPNAAYCTNSKWRLYPSGKMHWWTIDILLNCKINFWKG